MYKNSIFLRCKWSYCYCFMIEIIYYKQSDQWNKATNAVFRHRMKSVRISLLLLKARALRLHVTKTLGHFGDMHLSCRYYLNCAIVIWVFLAQLQASEAERNWCSFLLSPPFVCWQETVSSDSWRLPSERLWETAVTAVVREWATPALYRGCHHHPSRCFTVGHIPIR